MVDDNNVYKSLNSSIIMIIVRTAVKEVLKEDGVGAEQISKDFMDRLEKKVHDLILESAKRARENGRRTVMGRDV